MTTLALATTEYAEVVAHIEAAGGEVTPDTMQDYLTAGGNLQNKLLACHHVLAETDGEIATLDAEIKRLQALKLSKQRKYAGVQFLLTRAVVALGVRKEGSWYLKTPLLRLRVSQSTEVVIENEKALPKKYLRAQAPKPDKNKIKAVLATGAKVRGARLQKNDNLTIY